jgi:very-short-patch-repair endonuclease
LRSRLRGKQLLGKKMRRQYSVGPYCIDLYCPEARLAIEVDGDSHFTPEAKGHDARRRRFIEEFGIRFVRFTNQDVCENLEGVVEAIAAALREAPSQSPPFKGGSEEDRPSAKEGRDGAIVHVPAIFLPLRRGTGIAPPCGRG